MPDLCVSSDRSVFVDTDLDFLEKPTVFKGYAPSLSLSKSDNQ